MSPSALDHTPWELAAYHFLKYVLARSRQPICTSLIDNLVDTVDWSL